MLKIILTMSTGLATLIVWLIFMPNSVRYKEEFKESQYLIEAIEHF